MGILAALDRHRVSFVVVGGLARVIHGTGETTADVDIVPSSRPENLCRLSAALEEIGALVPAFDTDVPTTIGTPLGNVTVVLTPDGTRGWDDLRRAANREPLGQGVRPSVASPGDLARMLSASDRDDDATKLRRLRRLIELERELSRGRSIER
jgi:hypothetical protein